MRFPYSVICALFAFPILADQDTEKKREVSTFRRAAHLFGTMSGRREYTDAGEKFENVTMLLYHPVSETGDEPYIKLIDSRSGTEMTEKQWYEMIRGHFVVRNPHYGESSRRRTFWMTLKPMTKHDPPLAKSHDNSPGIEADSNRNTGPVSSGELWDWG